MNILGILSGQTIKVDGNRPMYFTRSEIFQWLFLVPLIGGIGDI